NAACPRVGVRRIHLRPRRRHRLASADRNGLACARGGDGAGTHVRLVRAPAAGGGKGRTPGGAPAEGGPMRLPIWFSRAVLGAATLLMTSIAIKYMTDPVGAVAPQGIVLRTPEAVTIIRVSGGMFLGLALTLAGCLISERRLGTGLAFLATIATAIL